MGFGDPSEAREKELDERRGRVITVKDFAVLCGVSGTTVQAWLSKGMPIQRQGSKGVPHRLDSARCIVWLLRQEREREQGSAGAGENMADFKRNLAAVKLEKERLELEKLKGELIEMETVERILTNLIATARARLLALPSRLAPQLASISDVVTIREKLDMEMHEALEKLAACEPEDFLKEPEGD